ncbi:phosphoglucosamine mutase [Desulfoluna spongiiphila]|uniref:phosphoglucosamine mutase n=1 Tax=Desulfoluna spongiiphila TaxID=419481 RepID=UPI001255376B|nr:phosphoglucosamine mutase [Desulfoluna spongiiphila]VVS95511.1 phosphoglucosamine mutase bacterial type [Desulfoluna spongiiphila]
MKLFGTDGIRGTFNKEPMTVETALRVGQAVAATFATPSKHTVVIGRDTRQSGQALTSALAAGVMSMGAHVALAGVIPTPGVAFLTAAHDEAAVGVVISASHNPFEDNGIKLFDENGYKFDTSVESGIESLVADSEALITRREASSSVGSMNHIPHAVTRYLGFLKEACPVDLSGLNLVADASNGAASSLVEPLLKGAGAELTLINAAPNGININAGCGSEHPEEVQALVTSAGARAGLAFDGDADRLICVDETGEIVSGDQVIAIVAGHYRTHGLLANDTVVTTVMSNMGLSACLKEQGISHTKSAVGDRHVMLAMKEQGAVVGGEDSGHMIFLDRHTTGDGLLSALLLLTVLAETGKPLSELKQTMTVFPQMLINVDVSEKKPLEELTEVPKAIDEAEKALNGKGRTLVRYSGTQKMLRVMVEGEDAELTRYWAEAIAEAVRREIG